MTKYPDPAGSEILHPVHPY